MRPASDQMTARARKAEELAAMMARGDPRLAAEMELAGARATALAVLVAMQRYGLKSSETALRQIAAG